MRIVSGKYKGRLIQMPKGIRPTQEKVREALFDILGDIEGLSFLELFAGSGAVGLEASSRGVSNLVLVESDRACLRMLQRNIESLKLSACDLYSLEAEKAIRILYKEGRKFDIIFLDPPYHQETFPRLRSGSKATVGESLFPSFRSGSRANVGESLSKKALQTLGAYDILTPDGFIVLQHFKKDILPDKLGDLNLLRQRKYGDTLLSFYRKREKCVR